MKLSDATEGREFEVTLITDQEVVLHALRFGIDTGTRIIVEKNIRGGPVIVCKNQLEIAIGREIARAIEVEPKL
jgi:Fe2+ transport system protein FeoA